MGNEHSNHKELSQNGKVREKSRKRSVNGVTANITFNGVENDVNSETVVHQNGEPFSLSLATESPEPDFVIVETDCHPAEAQVISEIAEAIVHLDQVKKSKSEKVSLLDKMFKKKAELPADVESVQQVETSNEDQTDVSPPAAEPQPEWNPSGEEAASMIVIEHQEEVEQRADTSTQTDRKTEADISTQTGEDDDAAVNPEGPVAKEVVTETATTEDSLNTSVVVIAEEAVEDTANEEPSDNQTAGIMNQDVVVTENHVYESMVFRAERVEVNDNFEIGHCNPEETEPEIATEPGANPNKSIREEDMFEEETVSLEISSILPKVVADCIELVFAAVSESTDNTAADTSESREDEVMTADNGEEAGDMSEDMAVIETPEPEPNVITREAGDVPCLDEESVTLVMETIYEVAHEESNPSPANQDTYVEEHPVLIETKILIIEESTHEEVATNDAVVVGDAPEISEQDQLSPVIDNEPSKKCDSCPEEETIIVEVSSNELITTEECTEDAPGDEVKPESTPEVITSDDNIEIGEEAISDVGPETAEESEPSLAVVSEEEVIPETAIDVLAQIFESSVSRPQETAADNESPLEEEIITATVFVPLFGKQEVSLTVPEEPVEETFIPSRDETVAEGLNEDAIEALSNEWEGMPVCLEEDTAVQESSTEGEVTEENPSPCEEDATVEVLENTLESVVEAIFGKLEFTENIVEEPEYEQIGVPPVKITEESDPCLSVQEEENISPVEALLEDPDKDAPLVVEMEVLESVELTDTDPANSEEPVEEIEAQPKSEVLVVIIEPTEDEIIEEIICEDNSGDVPVEESSQIEMPDEHVAECAGAILETILEELIAEEAECDLATSEEVAPEFTAEEQTALAVVDVEVLEAVESTDTDAADSEEPLEESEPQPKSEVLVAILETTEDEGLLCEEDNSGDVPVERNSKIEMPNEPVAECVEAILETIPEELIAEEVECDHVTSEEVAPEEQTASPTADVEVLKAVESTVTDAVDSEEPEEENEPQPKSKVLVAILETTEDEGSKEILCEQDNSGDVPVEENSRDEPVTECVEAVLKAIVAECDHVTLIAEEAECDHVTSEGEAPKISAVTSMDMEALCHRLQTVCTSAVEESLYRIGGLEILSLGNSITVTIHVAPKTGQQ